MFVKGDASRLAAVLGGAEPFVCTAGNPNQQSTTPACNLSSTTPERQQRHGQHQHQQQIAVNVATLEPAEGTEDAAAAAAAAASDCGLSLFALESEV